MKKFIIPLTIAILGTAIGTGLFQVFTSFRPLSTIWKAVKWFFSLFLIKITVPIWAFISLFIALIVLSLLLALAAKRAHPVVEPQWKNYREDRFFDVDWTWGYIYNQIDPNSIKPRCPDCQRLLDISGMGNYDSSGITTLSCYHCKFIKAFDIDIITLVDRVERDIERNIKTGEYLKLDKSKQA